MQNDRIGPHICPLCSGIQDFPVDLFYGTGGLIGEIPFVCGGKAADRYNQCYSLQETGEWKEDQTATLNSARSNAAFGSVIINDKLVVAGGTNGSYLSTIELAAPNTKSTTLSMELPLGIYGSCVVPWSNNTFMVIGGRSEDYFYRAETYYFNLETNKVTNGPALKTARRNHACHEMVINGELFVVVTGGEKQSSLSTEMLSKSSMNNEWEKRTLKIFVISYNRLYLLEEHHTTKQLHYLSEIFEFSRQSSDQYI